MHDGQIARLDQHVDFLDGGANALAHIQRINPGLSDNDARLARFAFRNKDVLQLAGAMSGGEQLRLGLPVS